MKLYSESSIRGNVVVIGGGIAGFSVATLLSRIFERVIVVDRSDKCGYDLCDADSPQRLHAHYLNELGCKLLYAIFPGMASALDCVGAVNVDSGKNLSVVAEERARPPGTESTILRCVSRSALDKLIWNYVSSNSKIVVHSGTEATSIQYEPEKGGKDVAKIRCISRDGIEWSLNADIAVVASGGHSGILDKQGGSWGIRSVIQRCDILYQSVVVSRKPQDLSAAVCLPDHRVSEFFVTFPIEGDRRIVTTGCRCCEQRAEAACTVNALERAQSLAKRFGVGDILVGACAIDYTPKYYQQKIRWNALDIPTRWPRNVFAVGDAVVSLTPFFGQGIPLALKLCAMLFRDLNWGANGPIDARHFMSGIESVVAPCWNNSAELERGREEMLAGRAGDCERISQDEIVYLSRRGRVDEYRKDAECLLSFLKTL